MVKSAMQFEASSTQLSATIAELIERMRDSGQPHVADVLTVLHVPLVDDWGLYDRDTRTMLLADDLPTAMRRQVVRWLLDGQSCRLDLPA